MSKHQADECEEIELECDFKSIGCDHTEVLCIEIIHVL